MTGLNLITGKKVLLYVNDSETFIKSKHEQNSRNGATEKFWALKVRDNNHLLDIQKRPLELYVDEDILNVLGYFRSKIMHETNQEKKTKHNEYVTSKKHIYDDQVFLPPEEFIVMQSTDINTMVKVSILKL